MQFANAFGEHVKFIPKGIGELNELQRPSLKKVPSCVFVSLISVLSAFNIRCGKIGEIRRTTKS